MSLERLELRAELYKTPDGVEDQAGQIIEQARKSQSGTMRMKRSLLVRAGQALAPDAFVLVLESENFDKEVASGKGPLTQIKKLAGKAKTFKKNVRKAEGHLRRLGNENDKKRSVCVCLIASLGLGFRLIKLDVCIHKAQFCVDTIVMFQSYAKTLRDLFWYLEQY